MNFGIEIVWALEKDINKLLTVAITDLTRTETRINFDTYELIFIEMCYKSKFCFYFDLLFDAFLLSYKHYCLYL